MSVTHCLAGLKPIRKLRRASARELSDLIGLKPTSYSRFERGERRMYVDQAIAIARRLGVKLDDLVHPLDEQAAALLCDRRDKAAIAAGRLGHGLWSPVTGRQLLAPGEIVPPPPAQAQVPPPPAASVPPPPPLDDADAAAAELADWNEES